MLIRCPKCGKPVYAPKGKSLVECGYCYRSFELTQSAVPLAPDTIDWKKPIYDAALRIQNPVEQYQWLVFLDDYADVPQRLDEVRRADQEKVRLSENGIRIATESWRIEQIVRDLERIARTTHDPKKIERILQTAREKEAVLKDQEARKKLRDLAEKVQSAKKAQDLVEHDLREIEELLYLPGAKEILEEAKARREILLKAKDREDLQLIRSSIDSAAYEREVEKLIEDLMKKPPMPEREEVLAIAYQKRALLKHREAKEHVRNVIRKILKKSRKYIITFSILGLLYGWIWYSGYVLQPRKLENARNLAERGFYQEAKDAFESLKKSSNGSVSVGAWEGLEDLNNQWAKVLLEQGDMEGALEKYSDARNSDAVLETRRIYAEDLEAKEQYGKAIEQWKKIPDSEEKVRELYTRLTITQFEKGEYEQAASGIAYADQEILAEHQITAKDVYRKWGEELAEQGRTNDAITALKKAGDDPETLEEINALYLQLADQMGNQVIQEWKRSSGGTEPENYRKFEETGKQFQTVDSQLYYWELLTEAGIDLTQVYPNGVAISGFMIPSETVEFEKYNGTKPLFIQRREIEYMVFLTDMMKTPDDFAIHSPEAENFFVVTLLPELWQRLPPERRAHSLSDVTSVFVLNLTYPYVGSCFGKYRMENYASKLEAGKKNNSGMSSVLDSYANFPLFNARTEMLLWKYPGDELMVLWRRSAPPKYHAGSFPGGIVLDWTKHKYALFVSAKEVGLSGNFDEELTGEKLQSYYQILLELGGE